MTWPKRSSARSSWTLTIRQRTNCWPTPGSSTPNTTGSSSANVSRSILNAQRRISRNDLVKPSWTPAGRASSASDAVIPVGPPNAFKLTARRGPRGQSRFAPTTAQNCDSSRQFLERLSIDGAAFFPLAEKFIVWFTTLRNWIKSLGFPESPESSRGEAGCRPCASPPPRPRERCACWAATSLRGGPPATEALFVRRESHWEVGRAIRGGVPICFPWFGNKADDPAAPAHGFVRSKVWRLESIAEQGGAVVVSMVTDAATSAAAAGGRPTFVSSIA